MFVALTGGGIPREGNRRWPLLCKPETAHPCIAMCKPSTSSSVATRIYSLFRTTKVEELFPGAAARAAGYSDRSFNWARKMRLPLPLIRSLSSRHGSHGLLYLA